MVRTGVVVVSYDACERLNVSRRGNAWISRGRRKELVLGKLPMRLTSSADDGGNGAGLRRARVTELLLRCRSWGSSRRVRPNARAYALAESPAGSCGRTLSRFSDCGSRHGSIAGMFLFSFVGVGTDLSELETADCAYRSP